MIRGSRYGSVLALLLVPAFLLSAEPKIKSPESIEEGKLLRLSVTDLPPDATVVWDLETLDFEPTGDQTGVAAGLAGKHRIRATFGWIENGKLKLKQDSKYVTIGKAKPPEPLPPVPPGPNPPTPPDPTPEPVSDAWFFVIEDKSKRAEKPDVLPLLDATWWNTLPIQENHFRIFGHTNADAKAHNLIDPAQEMPYILVLKPNGTRIAVRKLEGSKADIEAWVQKITGRTKTSKNLVDPVLIQSSGCIEIGGVRYCPTR